MSASDASHVRKKSYGELLRDPRWQKRRLEIMNRAGFACEECDDDASTLNVHHKLYRKGAMPWEYPDAELACLCENCHKRHHLHKEIFDALFAELSSHLFDRVIGYAQSLIQLDEMGFPGAKPFSINLLSWEHARGVADALWECGSYERSNIADCLCDHKSVDKDLVEKLEIGIMPEPARVMAS